MFARVIIVASCCIWFLLPNAFAYDVEDVQAVRDFNAQNQQRYTDASENYNNDVIIYTGSGYNQNNNNYNPQNGNFNGIPSHGFARDGNDWGNQDNGNFNSVQSQDWSN